MIDLRSMNKKALALITTFMIATQSLPAAFAESKMEYVTSGNKIVEQIDNTDEDIINKEIGSVEEFIEFRNNWLEEHKKIINNYSYYASWNEERSSTLLYGINPIACFKIASELRKKGIIPSDYVISELLYENLANGADLFIYLFNEALKNKDFDLSSICYNEKGKETVNRVFNPLIEIFREKKLDVDKLVEYYKMICDTIPNIGENINEASCYCLAMVTIGRLIRERLSEYSVKELSEYYEIANPKNKEAISDAIFFDQFKEGVEYSIDSNDSVGKLLYIESQYLNTYFVIIDNYAIPYGEKVEANQQLK